MNLQWRKSTFSTSQGDCVSVATLPSGEGMAVRDDKDPTGPMLMFTPAEWSAFIEGAKRGEFDLP